MVGFAGLGSFLGGYQGQGGLVPQLQVAQQAHMQQQQQLQALKSLAMARQLAIAQAAQPQGGQVGPTQVNPSTVTPSINDLIQAVSQSGMPANQQFGALDYASQLMAPSWRAQEQENIWKNFREPLGEARLKTTERGQDIGAANVAKRVGATERGQDIGAANVAKRVGATERGQDITAQSKTAARKERGREADQRDTTKNRQITSRAAQNAELNKIRQQQADTASDRAGTYKFSVMSRDKQGQEKIDLQRASLKEKNDLIRRGQDKQYQARIAAIAAKATPTVKAQLASASREFSAAANEYSRMLTSPTSAATDIQAAATKAAEAQQKMESLAMQADNPHASESAPAQNTPTQEDLEFTAKKYGMTVEQVKAKLGIQ